MLQLCVVSYKKCWRGENGRWYTHGGFPDQMRAIGSLFDRVTLLILEVEPRSDGIPLPHDFRIETLPLPKGKDLRRKLSVLSLLPIILLRIWSHVREADVVHLPLPGDLPLLGLWLATAAKKRTLARYGGSWEDIHGTTLADRLAKATMRRLARRGHVMIATGEGSVPPAPGMHWLFASCVSEEDLSSIRPNVRDSLGTPVRLAYVGRLSEEKGIQDLLESLTRLHHPERFEVTIFGDGPLRKELVRAASDSPTGVRFAGHTPRRQLLQQLIEHDLLVAPSRMEGYGKARLDGLACGLPLVTTPPGFGSEIVGHDGSRGWIVPTNNPSVLAESLEKLLQEDRNWRECRERCRRFAEERTIEAWKERIGILCEGAWNIPIASNASVSRSEAVKA